MNRQAYEKMILTQLANHWVRQELDDYYYKLEILAVETDDSNLGDEETIHRKVQELILDKAFK